MGTPLIAAHAGSRFARNVAQKIPGVRITAVLQEAIEKPRFMADLMAKGSQTAQKASAQRQINAFLLQAALNETPPIEWKSKTRTRQGLAPLMANGDSEKKSTS